MIIDLNNYRPKNESYEHFILKQVGRAFLFQQGIRCIGNEVSIHGHDQLDFGTPKSIIDVLGIDRRRRQDEIARKLFVKIQDVALEYGREYGILSEHGFWNTNYKNVVEMSMKDICFEKACEQLGYHKDLHKQIKWVYREHWQLRGIEAKVSRSDFRNGFSIAAEYTYLITPPQLVKTEELPKKVGLLEFDIDKFKKNHKWIECLEIVKKPKKEYDSMFYDDGINKKKFNRYEHAQYCWELLYNIAQENTEELIFWNPHIERRGTVLNERKV